MTIRAQVYIKFTRELYMLSKLRHPRVVELVGCAASTTELTILLEVSLHARVGSVKAVLMGRDCLNMCQP